MANARILRFAVGSPGLTARRPAFLQLGSPGGLFLYIKSVPASLPGDPSGPRGRATCATVQNAKLRCPGNSAIETGCRSAAHVPVERTHGPGTPVPHLRGGRMAGKLSNEELNPSYGTTPPRPGTKKVRMPSLDKLTPEPFGTLHDRSASWGHRVRIVDPCAMQRVSGRQPGGHRHVHVVDPALALVFPDPILSTTSIGMHCTLVVAFRLGNCIAVVRGSAPMSPSGCNQGASVNTLCSSLEVVTSILRDFKKAVAPSLDSGKKTLVARILLLENQVPVRQGDHEVRDLKDRFVHGVVAFVFGRGIGSELREGADTCTFGKDVPNQFG